VRVLFCPSGGAPAAARVIARCLDAHRMAGGLLHALAALGDATNEPHRQAADARRALAALAALQNARFGTATEARLFAALRVRAECVAAELDELDRQRQRDTHALGALARLAEDGLPSAAFDAALARYAHGAFEQMGRIEGVIFPAARRYLGDADWTGLDEPPADNAPATPPDTNEPADARRASD
ncbi:hemerythrin domain-containing protein, partial [Burkholderia cenocepacia]|uniref:hemerythrin domain-containing protein n=1 Tax=Burkholderia cenocepacia TaxID=95486 RepID=UPI001E185443|nr:universal stress protein [Burkholderia cenocepacia]